MFGRLYEVSGLCIECAQIVVGLDVRRLSLEHSFKLRNCFGPSAMLGQHSSAVISGADETRINFDSRLKLGERLLLSSTPIQHHSQNVMGNRRARRCGDSSTRLTLCLRQGISLQSGNSSIESLACNRR